jgi:cobalt-zinc-cadmium efflux system protein
MAHLRRPLAVATALNTGVLGVEIACGLGSNSVGLITDAAHNFSDETALVLLLLAYSVRAGLSGNFLRLANLLNSAGVLIIAAGLGWEATQRVLHPQSVAGLVVVVAGIASAVGNWGVARALRDAAREDPAIRLAYVHNLGDALLSLAPAVAGAGILMFGTTIADPLVAILIASVLIVSTLQVAVQARGELLWPKRVVCGARPAAEASGE